MLRMPFSADALAYARRLAAAQQFPDAGKALADLLQRWNMGLADTPAERRIALRLAAEHAAGRLPTGTAPEDLAPDDAPDGLLHHELGLKEHLPDDEDFDGSDGTDEAGDADDDAGFYAEAWQALR